MRPHNSTDWAHLGQAVHEARTEAGLSKTREWAARVGKSERTLLELERGGKVGANTLQAIEDALGWPRAGAYRVLNGLGWRELAGPVATPLVDNSIAAAILRIEQRLAAIEARLEEGGDGNAESDDRGSAPNTEAGRTPHLRAARTTGMKTERERNADSGFAPDPEGPEGGA